MSGLSLLAPLGLLGLIGIPLIILYHMRRDTPHSRIVPTTRFWHAAEPVMTERPKFRPPPISLPLLLQLAAVALIGLALARPTLSEAIAKVGRNTEPQQVILILDGSTSMEASYESSDITRFEAARQFALEELGELQQGDVATVMIMGANPITMQATDSAGLRALRERIAELPTPGGVADLSDSLSLAGALLLPELQDRVVVLTDGAVIADPEIVASIAAPIELHQFNGENNDNLAVTSFSTSTNPSQPDQISLFAGISNFSTLPVVTEYILQADEIEVERKELEIGAEETVEVSLDVIPPGTNRVTLTLLTDDQLDADNMATLMLSNSTEQEVLVQLVSDQPMTLERALTSIPGVRVITVSTNEFVQRLAPIAQYDLAVFDGMVPLAGMAPALPTLYVAPPLDTWPSIEGMMTAPLPTEIQTGDPVLADVDLAGTTYGDTPAHALNVGHTFIAGSKDGPLLYRGSTPEAGMPMFVMTFDLADSNLPHRNAFPILMTNVIRELVPPPPPTSIGAGESFRIVTSADATSVEFTKPDGAVQLIPPVINSGGGNGGFVNFTDTGKAGAYGVTVYDSTGLSIDRATFVVQAGNLKESDLRPNPNLTGTMASVRTDVATGSGNRANDIWPLLALIALAVVLVEWGVTRYRQRRRQRWAGAA